MDIRVRVFGPKEKKGDRGSLRYLDNGMNLLFGSLPNVTGEAYLMNGRENLRIHIFSRKA